MSFKTKIAALLALPALACAGARPGAAATDPRDARAEHLYRVSCASCHRLRDPAELTAPQWRQAVGEHRQDAKLTPDEEALILDFLVRHAAGAPGDGAHAPARAMP